jgi:hypothetical protein
MNKQDVKYLKIGDRITLKHNLGVGTITKIALTPDKEADITFDSLAKYPMIQFHEDGVGKLWCTYLVIDDHYKIERYKL